MALYNIERGHDIPTVEQLLDDMPPEETTPPNYQIHVPRLRHV
jgi:hypothetical protein